MIELTKSSREDILTGAEQVFFKAMLDGYAGNEGQKSQKTKTPDGYVNIEYVDGDYRVLDRYCVTPYSCSSTGTTTIFFLGNPVWWMSYGGRYEDEVIPFLKEVLAVAYKNGDFCGGRGPKDWTKGDLQYQNEGNPIDDNTFEMFEGAEVIIKKSEKVTETVMGGHRYWGMALI